jgi:hypothetical protein
MGTGVVGSISINMTSARLKQGRLEELLALLGHEIATIEASINPQDVRAASNNSRR